MESVPKTKLAWQRPSTIAWPRVWHRFQIKSKDGISYRLRIQEIPENRFEEVLTFMETYYANEEPLCRYFQTTQNAEKLKWARNGRLNVLNQKVSVIVTADEESPNPPLMGCLLLYVISKDDELSWLTDGDKRIVDVVTAATDNVDLFEWFGSDHYMREIGVCVAPQYRGMGIANHLISTVSTIVKAFQLPGYAAYATAVPTQTISKKLGFTLLKELEFRNYRNKAGQPLFPSEDTGSIMLLAIKYTSF